MALPIPTKRRTLIQRLTELKAQGKIVSQGQKNATRYFFSEIDVPTDFYISGLEVFARWQKNKKPRSP